MRDGGESTCQYVGRIRGHVVVQGSLLEASLKQDPSNTTREELLAEMPELGQEKQL